MKAGKTTVKKNKPTAKRTRKQPQTPDVILQLICDRCADLVEAFSQEGDVLTVVCHDQVERRKLRLEEVKEGATLRFFGRDAVPGDDVH